jgi:hypothetical protein
VVWSTTFVPRYAASFEVREPPLRGGPSVRPARDAVGTLHAVGQLNHLGNASSTAPGRRPAECPDRRPKSTLANKAARVRELVGLRRFDPDISRRDVAEQCPDPDPFVAEMGVSST